MATPRAMTVFTAEDLWNLGEDARFELIEGELVEMPSPIYGHGKVSIDLGAELRAFIRQHRLRMGYAVEASYLFARNPDTVLTPDVSIIAGEDIPLAERETGFQPVIPLLVVEVLSPSNRSAEIARKVTIYRDAGVRLIWIVDTHFRTVTVHRADGTSTTLRHADGAVLDGDDVLPGFRLSLSDVFGA